MSIKELIKNKKVAIISVSSLVLLVLISVLIILFLPKKPNKALINAIDREWSTIKTETQREYVKKLDKLTVYKLASYRIEDDRYIIKAKVEGVNLNEQLKNINKEKLPKDQNELDAFLCNLLEKSKPYKTTAEIYAYKINGKYHVSFSDDFINAMSGNLYEYYKSSVNEAVNNLEEGINQ